MQKRVLTCPEDPSNLNSVLYRKKTVKITLQTKVPKYSTCQILVNASGI